MPTRAAPDPATIARLQKSAENNPAAYRWRLAATAIAGDVALTTVQVLPWALPIAISILFVNRVFFYWLGAGLLLLLVWIVRPNFRFDGRELSRDEAPALFDELDALRRKLDVPGAMQVFLDDSFNASAGESRGILGLIGTRRVLTLGVPLLLALSRQQMLAVIGHEFGHFSRRHGRMGHWLYRARVGWIQFASHVDESDSVFDRAATWYARHFVPYFSVHCFVHSRQCEYEADSDSASAVGGRNIALALTRMAVVARLWDEWLPAERNKWQLESAEPPKDFYARFSSATRAYPGTRLETWLNESLGATSNWTDTHPSLAERLGALREKAAWTDVERCAGEELFGSAWPELLEKFNDEWQTKARPDWVFEHFRLKHVVQPLLRAEEASVSGWDPEKQLAHAKALRTSRPAEGLIALRRLHSRFPENHRVCFALGAALLKEKDGAGVDILRGIAKSRPLLRLPAYVRIHSYYDALGDGAQCERWSVLVERATRLDIAAVEKFDADFRSGRMTECSLPPEARAVILESIRMDSCVTTAWLMKGDVTYGEPEANTRAVLTIQTLVLAIDPEKLKRSGRYETDVIRSYQEALAMLLPPDEQAWVQTYFSTEETPTALRSRPELVLI